MHQFNAKFYISWMHIYIKCVHILIGPTKIFVRETLFISWMYVFPFYPVPWLHIQIEHTLAHCCHFKYFQLEIRGKSGFLVTISCLCFLIYACYHWFMTLSRWSLPHILWFQGRQQSGALHCRWSIPASY